MGDIVEAVRPSAKVGVPQTGEARPTEQRDFRGVVCYAQRTMRMAPADFAGRRVYIAGGSLGIGLAVAERCAALGAHLTLFARRPEPLAAAVRTVEARRQSADQRVLQRRLDVTDHEQVVRVMNDAVAETGVPDVLINCAGGAVPNYFGRISYEQFVATQRVNLHSCWSTVSVLLPHMKGRGGYIVNTASLAGVIGVFGYTDYCAAKFAVVGFSEALRSELKADDITVSVLCPPDTDTPGFAIENEAKPAETKAVSAAARVLSADAVAAALLRGMARGTFLIVPGMDGRIAVLVKRVWPGLVERVTDWQIRRVRRTAASS
jgi:3-dehydrosphinganine reductase